VIGQPPCRAAPNIALLGAGAGRSGSGASRVAPNEHSHSSPFYMLNVVLLRDNAHSLPNLELSPNLSHLVVNIDLGGLLADVRT